MKRIHAVTVAMLWVLAPVSGQGADLTGGLGGEVEFDSNARRTSNDEQEDVVFRISPSVELREDEGKLNYNVRYRFPWERAIEVQRIEGFRHFVNARAEYNFSERTVFTLSDNFSRSDSVNSVSTIEDGVTAVNTFNRPVNRNNLIAALSHSFTPRFQTTGRFNFRLFDSDLPNRANNRTFGLALDNNYQLSARHRVGGGLAVDYQDFDAANNGSRTPSQTVFANVFASWSWLIDETTSFEISAGPTFIDSNQDAPATRSEQDAVPFFQLDQNSAVVVSDLGSCASETFDGNTVQVLPVSSLTCANGVGLGNSGYQVFGGTPTPYDPGDLAAIQTDIQTILDAAGNTVLGFGPGDPESLSGTSWTIFAQTSLTKRWTPHVVSTLSYQRRNSTASGVASSAVVDFVSLFNSWRISELWDAALRADFTYRQSVAPVEQLVFVVDDTGTGGVTLTSDLLNPQDPTTNPNGLFAQGVAYNAAYTTRRVSQAVSTIRWGFSARVRRRITRNLSSGLRYTFNRQESDRGTAGGISDFNNHLVTLNVRYDFDRWNLW